MTGSTVAVVYRMLIYQKNPVMASYKPINGEQLRKLHQIIPYRADIQKANIDVKDYY